MSIGAAQPFVQPDLEDGGPDLRDGARESQSGAGSSPALHPAFLGFPATDTSHRFGPLCRFGLINQIVRGPAMSREMDVRCRDWGP